MQVSMKARASFQDSNNQEISMKELSLATTHSKHSHKLGFYTNARQGTWQGVYRGGGGYEWGGRDCD